MACAHRSLASVSLATRTNTTITAPASIADGDILVIATFIEDDIVPTPPTGFAQWQLIDHSAVASDVYIWWKRASSESGNYVVTHASAFTESYMCAVSGAVASGTPEDPAPTSNQGTSLTMTATGFTTGTDGDLIIGVYCAWDDLAASTVPTGTTPTFTERYDPGAANNVLYICDGVMTTAGATGDKSVTKNDTTLDVWSAALVSVKALVAGGRTTKNTRSSPLGVNAGMGFRMQ